MKNHEETPNVGSVADFYSGRSIFMTGATGFLGKVILEKLLYSCRKLDKVYILIRDKGNATAHQRIQIILSMPLFSRLKNEHPQDLNKVIPIIGDVSQHNLGLSVDDEKNIKDQVSVVFHLAATVRFREKLDVAVNTNVSGTKSVINLCKGMKNIKALVHISTAYSNLDHSTIEERIYPPPADLGEVMRLLEETAANRDEKRIEQVLLSRPNTYLFTKALAESYIAEHHAHVPTVIIRPSIVCASLRDPIPGWIDNVLGATGITLATVKGLNRVIFGDGNNILDVIPVDYVSNLTIVAATRIKSTDVTVYNCCTSSCNPISIERFFDNMKNKAIENNFYEIYPTLTFTESEWLLYAMTFLLQTVPAYLIDMFLRAIGRQPRHVKLQSRIINGRDVVKFVTSNSWAIRADRCREVYASLSEADKCAFHCDPSDINWDDYTALYVKGMSDYLVNIL